MGLLLLSALAACDSGTVFTPIAPPATVAAVVATTELPPAATPELPASAVAVATATGLSPAATARPVSPAGRPAATVPTIAAPIVPVPPTLLVRLLPTFTALPVPPTKLPAFTPDPTPTAGPTAPPTPSSLPTTLPARAPAPLPGYRRAATPLVVLDPGHGGSETGAVSPAGLAEKDVNLAIALAAAADLRAHGIAVLLTRSSDSQVNTARRDVNGNGSIDVDDDLQARVDLANEAGAWALVSIHNNAQPGDPATRGTTTYYCSDGLNPAASLTLATTLHTHLLAAIHGAGYAGADRGVRDDYELRKPEGHLYLLGPHNKRITRPSLMPGALGETLFLSNAADTAQLVRPAMILALGAGYADSIAAYVATLAP